MGQGEFVNSVLSNPGATLDDLTQIRERWDGPLLVKGVLTARRPGGWWSRRRRESSFQSWWPSARRYRGRDRCGGRGCHRGCHRGCRDLPRWWNSHRHRRRPGPGIGRNGLFDRPSMAIWARGGRQAGVSRVLEILRTEIDTRWPSSVAPASRNWTPRSSAVRSRPKARLEPPDNDHQPRHRGIDPLRDWSGAVSGRRTKKEVERALAFGPLAAVVRGWWSLSGGSNRAFGLDRNRRGSRCPIPERGGNRRGPAWCRSRCGGSPALGKRRPDRPPRAHIAMDGRSNRPLRPMPGPGRRRCRCEFHHRGRSRHPRWQPRWQPRPPHRSRPRYRRADGHHDWKR